MSRQPKPSYFSSKLSGYVRKVQDGTVQWRHDRTTQFNGDMTASLKISLMFLKLLTEKMMIMSANSNLLMTKSVIPGL